MKQGRDHRDRFLLPWTRRAASALALACACVAPSASAGHFGPADYIVRFVQYVRWPADDGAQPWRVCVTRSLADARSDYAGSTVRGRAFEVSLIEEPATVTACQVLDLTGVSAERARPFLEAARPAAVLTVGDGASFCSAGGVICLDPKGASAEPAFEINLSAVKRSGLAVHARMMQLGRRGAAGDTP